MLIMTNDTRNVKPVGYRVCILFFMLLTLSAAVSPAFSQTAEDVVREMDQKMRGESSYAEMTMTIVRPRYTREISMKSWALGNDYSLILITAPARDEGTAYLKRNTEIWNYVPTIDRTIKMPPSMMSQSWMGSDFSNDDLVRESSIVEDYEHSLLREEEYDGMDCWVVQMVPKPETPIVWGKVLVWVAKDGYLQLKVENYDQSEELANTIQFSEIETMDERRIPSKMTLIPADKPEQRTVLKYHELDFNIDIEQSFFTLQNMKRVR